MNGLRPLQAVDPDEARREAQRILSDRRFRSDPAPRPLRGPLRWIGDRISSAWDWLVDRLQSLPGWDWAGDRVASVPAWGWLAIILAGFAAVAALVVMFARRRRVTHAAGERGASAGRSREDPDALDRAADDAERDGDLDRAVRLRFRAGLLRLGDRGAIRYRPSVTTTEVRRALGSATFDELARTFEAVAYGGRAAGGPDAEAARREWPRVLEEVGKR